MEKNTRLFIMAYLQVGLVTANTYFISVGMWLGIAAAGFGISYLWAKNVKKISVSNELERLSYACGAMFGGLTGVFLATLTKKITG